MNDDQDFQPLINAINLTASNVPVLRKGDRNTHGNYNYVSIDDMFEHVASLAHKNGLSWSVNEVSSDVVMVGERPAFKAKYEYGIMHDSGVVMDGFFSITILHPIQGAQTAGSAMSYASKMFLRHTFSVVTGEQDADATDNAAFDFGNAPAAKVSGGKGSVSAKTEPPAKPSVPPTAETVSEAPPDTDAETMANVLKIGLAFLPTCSTVEVLNDYWLQNEETFKLLKAQDPAGYKELTAAFRARKAELSK